MMNHLHKALEPLAAEDKRATKTFAGVWIDHREAVVVLASGDEEDMTRIKSGAVEHVHRSGRSLVVGPFEPQMVPSDNSPERQYTGSLVRYYDEVLACLQPASAVLLFGPGEAKGELKNRLERDRLDLRINKVETAAKMTERQILQKVRQHYFGSGTEEHCPPGPWPNGSFA